MNEMEHGETTPSAPLAEAREFTLHPRTPDLWRWQALAWVLLLALPGVAIGGFGGKRHAHRDCCDHVDVQHLQVREMKYVCRQQTRE